MGFVLKVDIDHWPVWCFLLCTFSTSLQAQFAVIEELKHAWVGGWVYVCTFTDALHTCTVMQFTQSCVSVHGRCTCLAKGLTESGDSNNYDSVACFEIKVLVVSCRPHATCRLQASIWCVRAV